MPPMRMLAYGTAVLLLVCVGCGDQGKKPAGNVEKVTLEPKVRPAADPSEKGREPWFTDEAKRLGVTMLNRLIYVVLLQASLDYLGLVPQTRWRTWGGLISAGKQFILNDPAAGWWVPVFPALAIISTIFLLDHLVRKAT